MYCNCFLYLFSLEATALHKVKKTALLLQHLHCRRACNPVSFERGRAAMPYEQKHQLSTHLNTGLKVRIHENKTLDPQTVNTNGFDWKLDALLISGLEVENEIIDICIYFRLNDRLNRVLTSDGSGALLLPLLLPLSCCRLTRQWLRGANYPCRPKCEQLLSVREIILVIDKKYVRPEQSDASWGTGTFFCVCLRHCRWHIKHVKAHLISVYHIPVFWQPEIRRILRNTRHQSALSIKRQG